MWRFSLKVLIFEDSGGGGVIQVTFTSCMKPWHSGGGGGGVSGTFTSCMKPWHSGGGGFQALSLLV